MKKIAFHVPNYMHEILVEDKENFNIELGAMGNRIFEYYSNKDIHKLDVKLKFSKKIQFNLTLRNEDIFFTVLKEQNCESESEYMRNAILAYISNPRYKREEIIFSDNFLKINEAIQNKKKLNLKYKGKTRTVNPYFIKVSDRENRNYLFCYCEENDDYRCYIVSEMSSIFLSKEDCVVKDKKYIEDIFENFDPFRSYGKRVKVKMTHKSKILLEKVITNRPKLIEENGDIYTFECDEKLAQIYFPQFFSSVEVLEPESLREWFKNIYYNAYKIYVKEEL